MAILRRIIGKFDSRKTTDVETYEGETSDVEDDSRELKMLLDAMPVNVMVCDPRNDYKISYINETSLTTLRSIEHLLPCGADDMLGSNIDIFHKNPEHQRRILSDAQIFLSMPK